MGETTEVPLLFNPAPTCDYNRLKVILKVWVIWINLPPCIFQTTGIQKCKRVGGLPRKSLLVVKRITLPSPLFPTLRSHQSAHLKTFDPKRTFRLHGWRKPTEQKLLGGQFFPRELPNFKSCHKWSGHTGK